MPLGQSELSEPLEYSGYEHATLGFIGRSGEGNLCRPLQKLPDLLN